MIKPAEVIERFFNNKRFNLIAFGIIAVMVLIAYSNTFTASFHFDDIPSIMDNPTIRHATIDNILKIVRDARPVVYLSIMFNYQVGGVNVAGYHAFNIAVHIANSYFLYLFFLWTLTLPQFSATFARRARYMALFAGLLFGVHPIQTESVTYIISRSELLATFFYLATFLLLIKGSRPGKFYYMIGMPFTSLLAMSSKEWAVTLPALLLLYDFLFLAEGKAKPMLSRWYIYLLTALPVALVLSKLNLFSAGGSAGVGFNVASTTGVTWISYLYTSLNVIWTYIRLLLLPINQNLDYNYQISKTIFEFPTVLSLLGHIAVVVASFWGYIKKGWTVIPFGVAWFYIGLSPTQSIVPIIDFIFEHRVYMPSVGFFIAFIAIYEQIFDWRERKNTVPLVVSRKY